LTRAITIIALTCFLVVGAAAAGILGRNSVPAAGTVTAPTAPEKLVSNKEGKQDRLAVAALALAAFEPQRPAEDFNAPLRQAFAAQAPFATQTPAQTPAEIEAPKLVAPAAMPLAQPAPAPKVAAKPAPQKPYTLLSDEQIAGIKERLRLSPDQASYWPAVETALRAVARKIHATRQTEPHVTGVPIDPDSAEVQQLKSAAMPLLFQLREDQKREVRSLARLIGLDRVASMI
jgi:hypothetical protein